MNVRTPWHGTPIEESLNLEEQNHLENSWVWSRQGVVNMHLPLRWGEVGMSSAKTGEEILGSVDCRMS